MDYKDGIDFVQWRGGKIVVRGMCMNWRSLVKSRHRKKADRVD